MKAKEKAMKMETEVKKQQKADKNLKEFFGELKKEMLDKSNDDEQVLPGLSIKVNDAKNEVKTGGK
jgi:hypothetical protein